MSTGVTLSNNSELTIRVSKFTQADLLTDKPKNKTKTPPVITRYNPTNPNIKNIIYSNWNIIENCDELK